MPQNVTYRKFFVTFFNNHPTVSFTKLNKQTSFRAKINSKRRQTKQKHKLCYANTKRINILFSKKIHFLIKRFAKESL